MTTRAIEGKGVLMNVLRTGTRRAQRADRGRTETTTRAEGLADCADAEGHQLDADFLDSV